VNAGSRRPIFDGHNDALLKLAPFATDDLQRFLDGGTSGHIDLPRALNEGSVTMSCRSQQCCRRTPPRCIPFDDVADVARSTPPSEDRYPVCLNARPEPKSRM